MPIQLPCVAVSCSRKLAVAVGPTLLTDELALVVRLELTVSVAVTVCWAVVWNVTEKVCRPASAAVNL